MSKLNFEPEKFFNLSNCQFLEIFYKSKFAWEALPKIAEYIELQFKNKKLISNFGNKNNIFIGKGTIVQDGATIIGPAIIGRNCVIGHSSLIRENCLLEDNVHIGHAVETKNSIFLKNARVAHLSYIGDSIIGCNTNISGGVILANFRLDKKPITVRYKNQIINTELKKFGAVVGDNSNIGVNSVLNPGTILGKNTVVHPLNSVIGAHKDNEIIK